MTRNDRGAVTVEAAIALGALVLVLGFVLAGASAAIDQIRCVDAAREAARLAARGDPTRATSAATTLAPASATIRITYTADTAHAHVEVDGPLPGIHLTATAHSALEPTTGTPAEAPSGTAPQATAPQADGLESRERSPGGEPP